MTLPYMISEPITPVTSEQLVLYYAVIYHFLYNFNTLIWLTGLLEVASTCSRRPNSLLYDISGYDVGVRKKY